MTSSSFWRHLDPIRVRQWTCPPLSLSFPPSSLVFTHLAHFMHHLRQVREAPATEERPYEARYEERSLIRSALQQISQLELDEAAFNSTFNYDEEEVSCSHSRHDRHMREQIRSWTCTRLRHVLAVNLIDTEERGEGSQLMNEVIHSFSLHPLAFCFELVDCYNQMALLEKQRAMYSRSQNMLFSALRLYRDFRLCDNAIVEEPATMDMYHTATLALLAQVYSSLNQKDLSATYCQLSLRRHLNQGGYDRKEWATSAMGLALYWLDAGQFSQAHHCLLAAGYHITPQTCPVLENSDTVKWQETSADLSKLWGLFHARRLERERKRLVDGDGFVKLASAEYQCEHLGNDEDRELVLVVEILDQTELSIADKAILLDSASHQSQSPISRSSLNFTSLKLPPSYAFEQSNSLLAYKEAAEIFRQAMHYYEQALSFFVFDGFVSEHIGIKQEQSALYACLQAFEPDSSQHPKYFKRRIDLLTPLAQPLNRAYFLELYQQLHDELAHCHRNMSELKHASGDSKKANEYAVKAISLFIKWIDSFFDKNTLKIETEHTASFISAHFHVARLYTRLTSAELPQIFEWHKKALEYYSRVLHICEELKIEDSVCKSERSMSTEMISLIPHKLDKFVSHGVFSV